MGGTSSFRWMGNNLLGNCCRPSTGGRPLNGRLGGGGFRGGPRTGGPYRGLAPNHMPRRAGPVGQGPLREPKVRGGYHDRGHPRTQVTSPPRPGPSQTPPQRQNYSRSPRGGGHQQAQRQASAGKPARQSSSIAVLKDYFKKNNLGEVPFKVSPIGPKGK